MNRLIEKIVFSGLVTIWFFAGCPTRRSSLAVKATMDGVVRWPSAFWMTTGSPPSITATQEFVVPRSIPMILPMWYPSILLYAKDQRYTPDRQARTRVSVQVPVSE